MKNLKRKLVLIVMTVLLIACSGIFFHNPPSLVDTITGATPKAKAKKAALQEKLPLAGDYLLYINTNRISNTAIHRLIATTALGEESGKERFSSADTWKLALSDSDPALKRYAKKLIRHLHARGMKMTIITYSNTMLISRAIGGKFDVVLLPKAGTPVNSLKRYERLLLAGDRMEAMK